MVVYFCNPSTQEDGQKDHGFRPAWYIHNEESNAATDSCGKDGSFKN
jgi:hypothetical protein